jgi:hypothetical protein
MIGLQLAPVVLSLMVLAAHFLRGGHLLTVVLLLMLLGLLALRRRWVPRLVQVALLLGAAEWLRTLAELVTWRARAGQPASRLVLILGTVAVVTGLSALVFGSARLRNWYQPEGTKASRNDGANS